MRLLVSIFLLLLGLGNAALASASGTVQSPDMQMGKSPGSTAEHLPEAVRGVWLTNVASDALYSRKGIEQAVALCAGLGINTIFVVTWNKGQTLYPSQVMREFTGVSMDPALDQEGHGRDPLQEVIDAARPHGIRVIAWFEFGFASSHRDNGGLIGELKPEWKSLNAAGELVTKNGFDWLNALDPEVQAFLTSLVLEVVRNYDVDGVQGDDRLPAMPSEGGYNPAVVAQYRSEHDGRRPPANSDDAHWEQWLDWRAGILNRYAADLYAAVKAEDPDTIVSFSPSIFPWSKEQYLQDWPNWLEAGNVDLLVPQVYRHSLGDYRTALHDTLAYIPANQRRHFAPGMLIRIGDQMPDAETFAGMLAANRDAGLLGEVFFYYEGLENFRRIIEASYRDQPVRFPAGLEHGPAANRQAGSSQEQGFDQDQEP